MARGGNGVAGLKYTQRFDTRASVSAKRMVRRPLRSGGSLPARTRARTHARARARTHARTHAHRS